MSLKKLYGPVLGLIVDGKKGLTRGLGNIVTAYMGGPLAVASAVLSDNLTKKAKVSANATDRLFATLDPNASRKIVLGGPTAMATDVCYQSFTGTKQEYYHQVLIVASHQVTSIDQIWFDNELAWNGTAQGRFAGYLEVATKLVGVSGAGFAIDGGWGANHSLTGCAHIHLRFKLTGNSKKAESPFAQAVPSRVTVRGKGALVFDPRPGTQSATDQTTWSYGTDAGRNPALQLLWYLLGWKIGGKLAVGRGIPAERIDLQSFLTAANVCDEAVALAAGGTEPRYRADGVFSESDDPGTVIGNLEAAMNGRLRDAGGKIALMIFKNDLASPVQSFTEADILGDDLWRQTPPVDESFNIVRGRYVDASDNSLYQLAEYPEVTLASTDGIERIDTFDLPVVQSPSQAQRLAKTRLQRKQYAGVFTATFNAKAWAVTLGDIVQQSHSALGWSNKLFRVTRHGIAMNGQVALELQEEHSDIYAWAASETAAVVAAAPTVYDPKNSPEIVQLLATAEGATKNRIFRQTTDPAGDANNAVVDGDIWVDISTTPMVVKSRIGGSWQFSANYVTEGTDIGVANGATRNLNRDEWASAVAYGAGDFFQHAGTTYTVETAHTSSGTVPDLTKVKALARSTAKVPTVDLTGTISELQLAADAVTAAKIAVGAINDVAKFAQSIRPPEILASLPTAGNYEGRLVFTGGKLWRYVGTAFTVAVPSADITGQLTDAQIADIAAAKLTGQIVGTQITDGAVVTAKLAAGAVSTAKLAAGAVTAGEIAAGAIVTEKLAAGAVTAAKIAAGTITAAEIAADTITAGQIAAAAIGAAEIAAGAIIADKIAADAVVAVKIAAGAVVSDKIAADAVTAAKIAAGSITTLKLAAGAVTANEIAAGAITASKVSISVRGVNVGNVSFYIEGGVLKWTGGQIQYVDDAGAYAFQNIAAGSAAWQGDWTYAYWVKGSTSISITAVASTAVNNPDHVLLATWSGGTTLAINNGAGTIIDGDRIVTGTIHADRIRAGTITGDRIAAGAVTADKMTVGSASGARMTLDHNLLRVYDANNVLRVELGIF